MLKPAPKGVLARKLTERTMQGRARLYHWLRLNYDELAAAKSALNYTWKDLAETVGDAGATNAFGKRPDAEAVRKAWLKLEADKARDKAKANALPLSGAGQTRLNAPDRSHPPPAPSLPERQPDPIPTAEPHGLDKALASRFQRRPVVMRGVPATNKKETT